MNYCSRICVEWWDDIYSSAHFSILLAFVVWSLRLDTDYGILSLLNYWYKTMYLKHPILSLLWKTARSKNCWLYQFRKSVLVLFFVSDFWIKPCLNQESFLVTWNVSSHEECWLWVTSSFSSHRWKFLNLPFSSWAVQS